MRKILLIITCFLLLITCDKKSESQYFVSENLENELLKGISELNKLQNFKYYYLYNYSDTVVIMSSSKMNEYKFQIAAKKIGTVEINGKKIILTEPINSKEEIIKNDKLNKNDFTIDVVHSDHKISLSPPIGIVYIVENSNDLKAVYRGDVSNFLKRKEYKLTPLPSPTE